MTRGRTVLRCLAVWTAVLAGATFPAAVFGQPVPLVVVLPDEPRPGDPVTVAASGIPAGAFAVLYNAEGKRLARAKFFYYMSAFPVPSVEEDAPPPRPPVITTAAPPSVSPAVPFSSRTQAGPPATCFAAILTIPSTAPPGDMLVRVETASTTAAPPRPLAERFFRAAARTFTS